MTNELKNKLRELADKYEVSSFTESDPSQFLRWYEPETGRGTVADVEATSFIAAMLAFGNRKQFIPKIQSVLETADRSLGSISEWLKAGAFKKDFPKGAAKFYRFYSYDDMQIFFGEFAEILKHSANLGDFFETQYNPRNKFFHCHRKILKKKNIFRGRDCSQEFFSQGHFSARKQERA